MKRQLNSFACAFKGFASTFLTEGHMRFHLVAAFFVLLFAYIGNLEPLEWAILILTIGSVISAELINTALELLCDRINGEFDPVIGKVKDIAAGAVLAVSVGATGVAVCLFLATGKLAFAFQRILNHPWFFIPLGICAVLSVLFVAFGGAKFVKKEDKNNQ